MAVFYDMLNDFINLIFPENCACCNNLLNKLEKIVCYTCMMDLPKTQFHKMKYNPIHEIFKGRLDIHFAGSYLHFRKSGKVQKLMHEFKYKNKPEIGQEVGKWYGEEIKRDVKNLPIDLIIPVPLHKKKLKLRGYNQAEKFGIGLGESMGIICKDIWVEKTVANESQTKKNRLNRFINTNSVFLVPEGKEIRGKNILLVDDVITTGATLENLALAISNHQPKSINIATIAIAS
jgi:ComF family protein